MIGLDLLGATTNVIDSSQNIYATNPVIPAMNAPAPTQAVSYYPEAPGFVEDSRKLDINRDFGMNRYVPQWDTEEQAMLGLDLMGADAPKVEDTADYRAGFDAGKARVSSALKGGELSLSDRAAAEVVWRAIQQRELSGKSAAYKAGWMKGEHAAGGTWVSEFKKVLPADYVILAAVPVLGLVLGAVLRSSGRLLGGALGAVLGAAAAAGIEVARGHNPIQIIRGYDYTTTRTPG